MQVDLILFVQTSARITTITVAGLDKDSGSGSDQAKQWVLHQVLIGQSTVIPPGGNVCDQHLHQTLIYTRQYALTYLPYLQLILHRHLSFLEIEMEIFGHQ